MLYYRFGSWCRFNNINFLAMKIKDLLDHVSFWCSKTDEECVELAINENGVDAEQALLNMLERDFCLEFAHNLADELKKI